MRAQMILRLCEKFHKLPSEILEEDVELLQLIDIAERGRLKGERTDDGR